LHFIGVIFFNYLAVFGGFFQIAINGSFSKNTHNGDVEWVTWGKRKEEPDRSFPNGRWARLDSVKDGRWERFHPQPVLVPAQAFMEKDHERKSHLVDVAPGQAIQGLLAKHNDETRIYVVTTDTSTEYDWIHDRWPRLVELSEKSIL
jgi:putative SOS response-associated peptidase YedK